jgi:hypothetical protein
MFTRRKASRIANKINGIASAFQQADDEQAELAEVLIAQGADDRAGLEDDAERDAGGDADEHAHVERAGEGAASPA